MNWVFFFLHVIDYETYIMFRTSAMDYFPPHLISCHLNFAPRMRNRWYLIVRKIYIHCRITFCFLAVKTHKTKIMQNFMLNHILYYRFSKKKLAEKGYPTFNLRFSRFGQLLRQSKQIVHMRHVWHRCVSKKPGQPNVLN